MPIHNKLQTSQPFLAQVPKWNVYNRNFYKLDLNNTSCFTSKDPHFPNLDPSGDAEVSVLPVFSPGLLMVLITG